MQRNSVDLAIALRSVSIHRMNIARKIRRLQKKEEKSFKVLQEQSELESCLMIISHDVNQLRQAFRKIARIEKSIQKHKEAAVVDKIAGRNRGGFPKRR